MAPLSTSSVLCSILVLGASVVAVEADIDNLLEEFKRLSSLKDVFLSPPDPRRPSLDLTPTQVQSTDSQKHILTMANL